MSIHGEKVLKCLHLRINFSWANINENLIIYKKLIWISHEIIAPWSTFQTNTLGGEPFQNIEQYMYTG